MQRKKGGRRWQPPIVAIADVNGGLLPALALRREVDAHLLAQGQTIFSDPKLAIARHGAVEFGQRQGYISGQFAFAHQIGLHLVAHIGGNAGTVKGKGVARKGDTGTAFGSGLLDILGASEERAKVAARRRPGHQVGRFLPIEIALFDHGLITGHLDLGAAHAIHQRAALAPEGHLHGAVGQVGVAGHVRGLFAAAGAQVGNGSQGNGFLYNIQAKAIGLGAPHGLPTVGNLLVRGDGARRDDRGRQQTAAQQE